MTSSTITKEARSSVVIGYQKTNDEKQNGTTNIKQTQTKYVGVDTKGKLPKEIGTDYNFKRKIVWQNAIGFVYLHLAALYGVWLIRTAHPLTNIWTIILAFLCGQGITMGAHRLFSHKTFKATLPVRFVLIVLQTMAGQNCLYVWTRDHRLHHKYSDTDADPHNSHRGFFFSHMGWLMSRKHPAVISKGKTIDMSDLEADPIVMFQKRFYKSLYMIFSVAIPVSVPVYLWDESYYHAFFVAFIARYVITLHFTWLVNSAAHMFGTKPYDDTMRPVESWIVSVVSTGEGWHNYHHAFPWDYRASELGTKFNITTILIDILAYIGLVYDLKAATENMVEHRALKAGDGSHPKYGPIKIEKDATKNRKENEHRNATSDEIFIAPTKGILKTDLNENDYFKEDYKEEEYHKNENEIILVKDSSTGETTAIKRNVKEKHLLHG